LSESDARELRIRTWVLRLSVEPFVEIGFAQAIDFGIDPGELVSDDYRECQELADRQRTAGTQGLIVPSAALPGTRNVVVFGERIAAGYLDTPIDELLDIPASMTADPASPPGSLHALVRRRGQSHAELMAWQSDNPFDFIEPGWSFPGR
jgi:hypothetical protein